MCESMTIEPIVKAKEYFNTIDWSDVTAEKLTEIIQATVTKFCDPRKKILNKEISQLKMNLEKS